MAKHKKRLNIHLGYGLPGPKKRPLGKPEAKTKPATPKKLEPTIPFVAEDRMLLIGEGDFSFAKSAVEHHGCCDVTATCFDSQEHLFDKYKPQAQEHVQYLEAEGQTVLYDIDATKLHQDKQIRKIGGQWDSIIFNFPHVGGKTKDVNRQVRFNQELLVNFFKSAAPLLAAKGMIVVTLFEGEPYTLWNIRDLARHSGLEVMNSFKFLPEAYPGYSHSRTLGNIEGGGGWKGEDRDARSYVFQKKKDASAAKEGISLNHDTNRAERKRKHDAESSDDER